MSAGRFLVALLLLSCWTDVFVLSGGEQSFPKWPCSTLRSHRCLPAIGSLRGGKSDGIVQNRTGAEPFHHRGGKGASWATRQAAGQENHLDGVNLKPSFSLLGHSLQNGMHTAELGLNAPNISVKGFLQEMKNFQVSLDNSSPGVIELSKYLGAGGSAADAAPLPGLYEAKKGVKVRLSFKIWYLSDFGETLWISGNHPALGSWIPQNGLQLKTTASLFPNWLGTVEVVLDDVNPIFYKYVAISRDGSRLKWEEKVIDRKLPHQLYRNIQDAVENSKNDVIEFVCEDGKFNLQEKEVSSTLPLHGHKTAEETVRSEKVSNPPRATRKQQESSEEEEEAKHLVTFQVTVNTNYGEEVFVCGSDPALGSWIPSMGIQLTTTKDTYPTWTGRARLRSASEGKALYKYVIKVSGDVYKWEDRIPDRELVLEGSDTFINDGRFNQVQRQVTYVRMPEEAAAPHPPVGTKGRASEGARPLPYSQFSTAGELSSALKVVQARNFDLLQKRTELQQALRKCNAEVHLIKGKRSYSSKDSALEALAKVQEKLQHLEEARKEVHKQAKESTEMLERVKNRASLYETSKMRARKVLEKLQDRKRELEGRLAELRAELQSAQEVASHTQETMSRRLEQGSRLVKTLKEQLDELKKRQEEYEEGLRRAEEEQAMMKARERSLQDRLLAIHQEGIMKEKETEKLLLHLHDMQQETRKEQESELSAAQAARTGLVECLRFKEKELERMRAQRDPLHNAVKDMEKAGEETSKSLKKLEGEYERSKKKVIAMKNSMAGLHASSIMNDLKQKLDGIAAKKASFHRNRQTGMKERILEMEARMRKCVQKYQNISFHNQLSLSLVSLLTRTRDELYNSTSKLPEGSWAPLLSQLEQLEALEEKITNSLHLLSVNNVNMTREVQEGKQSLEELEEQVASSLRELEKIKKERKEKQGEVHDQQHRQDSLNKTLGVLRREELEVDGKIKAANQSMENLLEVCDREVTRNKDLSELFSSGLKPTEEEKESLETYVQQLRDQRDLLEEDLERELYINAMQVEAKKNLTELNERVIASLLPTLSRLEEDAQELREHKAKFTSEQAAMIKKILHSREELRKRTAQIQCVKFDRFICEEKHEATKRTEEEHNKTYVQSNTLLLQLRTALLAERDVLKISREELADELARTSELEARCQEVEKDLRKQEAYMRKVEAEKQELLQKIERLDFQSLLDEADQLRSRVEDEEEGIRLLQLDIGTAKEELEQLAAERQNITESFIPLSRERQSKVEQRMLLLQDLSRRNASLREIQDRVEAKKAVVDGLHAKHNSSMEEMRRMEKVSVSIQEEVLLLRKQVKQLNSEINDSPCPDTSSMKGEANRTDIVHVLSRGQDLWSDAWEKGEENLVSMDMQV
uniref:CBM20 domain-containing protein n=1 Tax=Guillardia theta TaxID=55529 RepID=A0A7S4JTC4_GUITH|mmetsp:Transcript_18562/g.60937  ORF Transcript_18562/g.60937 Transcript_18562/m.60937 type:complete len:1384 (+) Transcript_18562:277-4428(+)